MLSALALSTFEGVGHMWKVLRPIGQWLAGKSQSRSERLAEERAAAEQSAKINRTRAEMEAEEEAELAAMLATPEGRASYDSVRHRLGDPPFRWPESPAEPGAYLDALREQQRAEREEWRRRLSQ
jgi:hypothetical protein